VSADMISDTPSRTYRNWGIPAIVALIFVAAAVAAPSVFYPVFLMNALCFALFASAFNLLLGYAGLLSFGHAAFFGSAAYVTGYMTKVVGLSPEVAILTAVGLSSALGALFGVLALRRQGIYFAMITLAASQLVYFCFTQASTLGGENGLQDVPRGYLFGVVDLSVMSNMYFFVLIVTVLGLLRHMVRSSHRLTGGF